MRKRRKEDWEGKEGMIDQRNRRWERKRTEYRSEEERMRIDGKEEKVGKERGEE